MLFRSGAENTRKLLPTILKADLPASIKFHSAMHLMASGIFFIILWVGILSVPVLWAMDDLGLKATFMGFCLLGTLAVMSVFYEANVMMCWKEKGVTNRFWKFVMLFPLFMAVSMGFSLHNSIAVIQGYWGKKSSFVRTPKMNILNVQDKLKSNQYVIQKIDLTLIAEALFFCYFVFAIGLGVYLEYFAFMLFHILLLTGFGINFFYSLRHLSLK